MRLHVALLDAVQEDAQEQRGSDDADGISNSSVVNNRAVSSLVVQELAQALVAQHEVGDGHSAHEGSGDSGDPVVLLLIEEVHGSGPQHDHGQGLVGPAEVTPDDGVVDLAQSVAHAQDRADAQHGDAEHQTALDGLLLNVEPVSQHQTSGTEGRIAGGDGAGDHAQHSQSDAHAAHGLRADVIHGGGAAAAHGQQISAGVDRAAGSSPDQSDDALGHHGAVEHEVALLLTLHAASHQGALGGMEAGNGAAGHGDEHEAPDGSALRMHIGEVVPNLGDHITLGEDTHGHTNSHDDQADAEHGIDLTDDLVDGQEGGDEIVHQNQHQPEQLVGEDTGAAAVGEQELDQTSRAHGEHGTDHDQQHNAEHTHDVLHSAAQVDAGDLGDRGALVTLAEHTGEVIVDSTGENGTEGDPQEHNRTPQSTAQSAEDGTQASNVQQLDHEQLPLGQNHVVHAVIDLDSGSLTVIGPEGPIHQGAIGEIAADQQCQANEKANHLELSFQKHVFSSEAGAKTFTRLFSLTY